MKKVIISSTEPMTLATLLKGLPKYLSQFFHVQLVTAPGPDVQRIAANEGVAVECIKMTRRVTPVDDLIAFFRLCSFFARERPDLVHSYTPKAALLCLMAAAAVRVPHRVHSILGMPLMGARGATRAILSVTERVTYLLATHVLCTGPGLRDYVWPRLTRKPVHVIGDGGIGVDMAWFRNDFDPDARRRIRAELNLAPADFVVVYAGRFLPDKGIIELVDAVVEVHRRHPTLRLLLTG